MTMTFQPYPNTDSVNLSVGATSANALVCPSSDAVFRSVVRIHNRETVEVFIRFGLSGVVASTESGMSMAPGSVETFTLPTDATHVAVIAVGGGGGGGLNITLGGGV
jgi:hypothetical protein